MRTAGLKSWNKAKTTGSAPDARHSHSATLVQGKIFIFGGYGSRYLNDVNILNTGRCCNQPATLQSLSLSLPLQSQTRTDPSSIE